MERPKMSLAMWAALKAHIMKQREKKKQEQEADAAVERLRREQEMKRKQDAMTLEEIKEQHSRLEKKLTELKEEKHELFLCLKRVLNEDEKRRNEEDKEPNDILQIGHSYPNQGLPVGASNMFMIGNALVNRNPVMYKVGPPPQQNGAIKRPRSPSPPNAGYPPGYSYKTHVTLYGQKPTPHSTQNSAYYPHSTVTASGTSSSLVVTNSSPYTAYPVSHPAGPYPSQDPKKHVSAGFHVALQQSGYIPSNLHQELERQANMPDEKYYAQPGGISSGYPIRGQPQQSQSHQSRFQPPTSHPSGPIQVPCRKEDMLRRNLQNESQR